MKEKGIPMEHKEFKALISLLEDDDHEVVQHIEDKIYSLGESVIPLLENEWENNFNPKVQKRIEDIIHSLQIEQLFDKFIEWKESENQDLLEGMCLMAMYQYPDLDMSKIRQNIEQLYFDAWKDFKPDLHPFDQVKALNSFFFSKMKFSANTKNFHSPSNSMINIVLESKKGNPITLCVIYMLLAQRLKMPVYGVNLPNLFVLTYKEEEIQFYINAFNRGLIFSKEDIDNYIAQLNLNPLDMFYQPCSNLEVIQRLMRQLILSFEKLGEEEKVREIKKLFEAVSDEEL